MVEIFCKLDLKRYWEEINMKESDIRDQDIFDEYIRLVTKDIKNFFEPSLFDLINCPACGGGYKD